MSLAGRLAGAVDTALDRTIAPGYSRVGYAVRSRLPGWPEDPEPGALAGRHVLVTGASSGLGTQTARELAALGAHVQLVVRDRAKGEAVRAGLAAELGEVFTLRTCDLGDLEAVARLADELAAEELPLAALVHNAGALPATRTESPQGHELSMALHVLAPVLLTERLLPHLAGQATRVVLVTSGGMYAQPLRDDDPEYLTGDYSGTTAYARSKRVQVELLPVLQRRWSGAGLHVYATHPGWADTPGVLESLPTFHKVTSPVLRDLHQGVDTTVWLSAVRPAPAGGSLWHDRRVRPVALTSKTRSTPGQVDRTWRWVCETLELPEEV
ncbi:SDR family NAD(P)-dependent oxidoreductase [Nocardioides euryhalodurans]|uniref:SDR family NAD(P)-dependent oxidoreductase n=1 Tax=Nocardioides euryhalodurans TaxID=2518370 RepID=A0A4P7GI06_9ACTN|nr:SDR family NAD(P)-dependent oxidoreductase [Nocardioides euryhalodurans]QBR91309.1 SDR family NAD(P)-dependent oxidoreductase [Nocardioides euryhalodurans]